MGQVFKRGVFVKERQLYCADRTVSLLAYNDLCHALLGIIVGLVVNLVPVYEHDDVGVLLNGPGLSQVCKLGIIRDN